MSRTAPQKQSAASETPVQRRRKVRLIPNAITLAVGENLRSFREERGMTQLELAMSAEVERTRVSKLELGLVNPSVLTLAITFSFWPEKYSFKRSNSSLLLP